MSISIKEFIAKNLAKLKPVTNIPKKEIELFIAHHLDLPHIQIQINDHKELTDNQINTLDSSIIDWVYIGRDRVSCCARGHHALPRYTYANVY